MEYMLIGTAALLVSAMTLFSGFGLGTILMPLFAFFFPVDIAIAATAIVHAASNIFKVAVVGKYADRSLVWRFGLPAIVTAFIGAFLLGYLSGSGEILHYSIGTRTAVVTPVKLVMGALILFFAFFELLPRLRKIKFDRKYIPVGGALSGFFGGLSGHQGALRSAFLVKSGISTESFVGTSAVIAFMVDLVRITTYAFAFLMLRSSSPIGARQWPLIATGIVAAFAGTMIGRRYLHKVTMTAVQILTGILLFGIAVTLGAGII